tara:strand:- start:212 stop:736 length:525 start_codon:yes stop_codon:yes gene_type:complete
MGQEFFINNQTLEDKMRKLLPSQGGLGAGFDLSASTQIIPIIDVTESAEGSNVRADLQSAFSFTNANVFEVSNTTTTIINNTGYHRIFGNFSCLGTGSTKFAKFDMFDGTSNKTLFSYFSIGNAGTNFLTQQFDFIVFLSAGDSVKCQTDSANLVLSGSTRQIATITGELVNPT